MEKKNTKKKTTATKRRRSKKDNCKIKVVVIVVLLNKKHKNKKKTYKINQQRLLTKCNSMFISVVFFSPIFFLLLFPYNCYLKCTDQRQQQL